MDAKTLTGRILANFSKVKLRRARIRVLKLRIKAKTRKISQKKGDKIPISSIVDIMIKSAVDKAKTGKKKAQIEAGKSYTILKDDKSTESGGYGAVQKAYGTAPHTSYVDYEKLFSYLGKLKSKSIYEGLKGSHKPPAAPSENGFLLAEKETIERGSRHVKYFLPHAAELDTLSMVPIAGMSSSEWEQFKLWMKLEPVMYRLKTSTS